MLSDDLKRYLALKRSVGFKFTTEETILRRYVGVLESMGKTTISTFTAVEWAAIARSPNERERRLGIVRRFAIHLRAEDPTHEVPPEHVFARKVERRVPYIFSRDDIARLLATVARRCHGDEHQRRTNYVVLGMLACTGMRVSEVIALGMDDVTEQGLVVRETKFRKSRLVPLHPTAAAILKSYLEHRALLRPIDDHVFLCKADRAIDYHQISSAFKAAVRGLKLNFGGRTPHMHDLRHSFAVRVLEQCPNGRDGAGRRLRALATYLGHANIKHTYWYFHSTPQLFRDMADACESAFRGGAL